MRKNGCINVKAKFFCKFISGSDVETESAAFGERETLSGALGAAKTVECNDEG